MTVSSHRTSPPVVVQERAQQLRLWVITGAIFGLGGALAMLLWRHRDRDRKFTSGMLKSLGRSLALNVVLGIAIPNIDLWCVSCNVDDACFNLAPVIE